MAPFLKKELAEAGFNPQEIHGEIIMVEDFVSKEEIQQVFDIINKTSEESWRIEYLSNLKRFCMEKFGRDDVDNLVAEGKFEVTSNWEDKNFNILDYPIQQKIFKRLDPLVRKANPELIVSGLATIQRMQEGVQLLAHTDQHTDPSIKHAAILYLNDDYANGELFFENVNFEIKPKAGSLLIFPGNEEYKHGVRPVGPGPVRYVLVAFLKIDNFYKNNKFN